MRSRMNKGVNMLEILKTTPYKALEKLVNTEGSQILKKEKFLSKIAKIDENLATQIEKSVEGVNKPTFELSGQANAYYNIASVNILKGNKIIGNGHISKARQQVGNLPNAVEGSFYLPNGDCISIKGSSAKFKQDLNIKTTTKEAITAAMEALRNNELVKTIEAKMKNLKSKRDK